MKNIQFLLGLIIIIINSVSCKENSNTPVVLSEPVFELVTTNIKANLIDADFIDSQNGFIVGDSNIIIKASDEANNLSFINLSEENLLFCTVLMLDINHILIGGENIILTSNNSGNTFNKSPVEGYVKDLYKQEKSTIFAGTTANGFNTTVELIYKSSDYGDTWEWYKVESELLGDVSSIIIYNDTTILVSSGECANMGRCDKAIYKITSSGNTSKTVFKSKDIGIFHMIAVDSSNLLAVGSKGNILSSKDKGDKWETSSSGISETLYSIAKKDDNTYFAVGDSGVIISTIDKGESWKIHKSGVKVKLNDICFPSSDYGIIVGDKGTIIKITFK